MNHEELVRNRYRNTIQSTKEIEDNIINSRLWLIAKIETELDRYRNKGQMDAVKQCMKIIDNNSRGKQDNGNNPTPEREVHAEVSKI